MLPKKTKGSSRLSGGGGGKLPSKRNPRRARGEDALDQGSGVKASGPAT